MYLICIEEYLEPIDYVILIIKFNSHLFVHS